MKHELMTAKKGVKFCVVWLPCIVFLANCIGTVHHRDMDLNTNVRSQQILNLRNYGDNDIDFFQQSERLMKNGFLDTKGDEYGYYLVQYRTNVAYGGLRWIHSLVATVPLIFVGFPTENAKFYLTAELKIFDSAGNLVKSYEKAGSFSQVSGLYYGKDKTVTEKAAREYSRLYRDLFQMANMQSSEINQALMAAGPVTSENNPQALAKIRGGSSAASSASAAYPGPDSGSSVQPSAPAQPAPAPAAPTLETGRYANNGTNITISYTSVGGLMTAYSGTTAVWYANSRISGNQLVITVYNAPGAQHLAGTSLIYTITSNTSFSGDDGNWVRRGYM